MPEKRKYRVPCSFTVLSLVEVEATSYEDACEAAQKAPLPPKDGWEYLSDSFAVDEECDYHVQFDDGRWERRTRETSL